MPRKQRFKPSRKPKSITNTQTDGQTVLDRSPMQSDGIPRAPEAGLPRSSPDVLIPPYSEEAKAS